MAVKKRNDRTEGAKRTNQGVTPQLIVDNGKPYTPTQIEWPKETTHYTLTLSRCELAELRAVLNQADRHLIWIPEEKEYQDDGQVLLCQNKAQHRSFKRLVNKVYYLR